MEKVISVNNWWDGPVLGLARCNGTVCIYERVFSEIEDKYLDEYIIIPISKEEEIAVMREWQEWCDAVSSSEVASYYQGHLNASKINNIVECSKQREKYRKKARFSGTLGRGYIPVDYNVEWYD